MHRLYGASKKTGISPLQEQWGGQADPATRTAIEKKIGINPLQEQWGAGRSRLHIYECFAPSVDQNSQLYLLDLADGFEERAGAIVLGMMENLIWRTGFHDEALIDE